MVGKQSKRSNSGCKQAPNLETDMEWNTRSTILIIVLLFLIVYFLFFQNKKKELLLSLFSVGLTLLAIEIVLRLFSPQLNEHDKMFEVDPNLGWKFIANKKGNIIFFEEVSHFIEINSNGFRDNPPLSEGDPSKKILVLGDSYVSNISVESNEVFTEVLQDRLQNTEVLNFGVNGYGQVQEYLQLQEWYSEINPDLLIVMIYIRNDFIDNIDGKWLYPRPYASLNENNLTIHPTTTSKKKSSGNWRIYRKSHLYNLLRRKIISLKSKSSHLSPLKIESAYYTPPESYLCDLESMESTTSMFRTMEKLLLKFSSYANEKNVPIVFALAPSIFQVEDEYWSYINNDDSISTHYSRSLPNDRLMEFAKNNQLEMIDLLPVLRAETKKGKALYFPNEQHWTAEGNKVVARSLFNYLDNRNLIKANLKGKKGSVNF